MLLDFNTLSDKIRGCWMGKNIGGVFGAPFEGLRQVNDAAFYAQDLTGGPPANDDLDLQIAWLAAVERYGRGVNASILGEYWLSYVIPNWVEYGQGKANLRAGLQPPMSGAVDNDYRNSNGCWIRSEIWACLAPGNPGIAARYAYEDAIVDHADQGMQAEIFCAALQSAAFVERDPRRLIDIALSYIPAEGKVAQSVRAALACRDAGLPYREAVAAIHECCPGSFGIQYATREEARRMSDAVGFKTLGEPGMDAPEHIGFIVAAWLYGDSFESRILLANRAGEDTDCTCATLGALLGIIDGASGLPEKWTAPLGDRIATMCVDRTWNGLWVPETCSALAERVLRVIPGFLGADRVDVLHPGGYTVECPEDLTCPGEADYPPRINPTGKDHHLSARALASLGSNVIHAEYPAFETLVDLMGEPFFRFGEPRKLRVTVKNCFELRRQEWARIRLHVPAGAALVGPGEYLLPLNNLWGARAEAEFTLDADQYPGGKLELLVEVQLEGRHSCGVTKVTLMRRG